MEEEIKKLYKSEIRKAKNERLRRKTIEYLKVISPYIGLAALTALLTTYKIKSGVVNALVIKETVDSYGNDKTITEYVPKSNTYDGSVTEYSKWELNENNQYERTIKTYSTSEVNLKIINSFVEGNNTINSLDDILGKPISIQKEIGQNLTEDEINSDGYVEAVTYTKDENDIIVTELPVVDTEIYIFMAAFFYAICGLGCAAIQVVEYSDNRLKRRLNYIDNAYQYKIDEINDRVLSKRRKVEWE